MKNIKAVSPLLCIVGLFAVSGARAETIMVTITVDGGSPISIDTLTTGGTATNYGSVDLGALNALLSFNGSAYQFTSLSGTSNVPGSASKGDLSLLGSIFIPAGATGSTSLSITEFEAGFHFPPSGPGTLTNSSSAGFDHTAAGDSQTSSSSFNSQPTPNLTLTSTGPAPIFLTGTTSEKTSFFQYTLDNTISFSLTPVSSGASPADTFTVTATATHVAEPSPLVPLSMVLAGFAGLSLAGRKKAF